MLALLADFELPEKIGTALTVRDGSEEVVMR
jgi:hypothetical protein